MFDLGLNLGKLQRLAGRHRGGDEVTVGAGTVCVCVCARAPDLTDSESSLMCCMRSV